MDTSSSNLVVPLVGAIQASIAVLLTIVFGVVAAQCNLLSVKAAKEVSRICVRMFLPALLIHKIGTNMHQDTAVRYVPVIIWSITYTLLSLLVGHIACRVFKFPPWVKLAVGFNNTTSLPLLLIESLKTAGILDSIVIGGDTASAALDRAESYFLINAMVSNSLCFAVGPRVLLRPNDEDADDDESEDPSSNGVKPNSSSSSAHEQQQEEQDELERGPDGIIDEETSLLPQRLVQSTNNVTRRGYKRSQAWISSLPPSLQNVVDILLQFVNAPLLGALAGAIIGLTPALHTLFFNPPNEGGHFNANITSSIQNIGSLFASTQIIVVGVKLSQSLRKMKAREESGKVPKAGLAFITIVRFFIWPAISIPFIWVLATKTGLLGDDPMLWFVMMLMPTGPPAMLLVALCDVTGCEEEEKMAIAKLLTVSLSNYFSAFFFFLDLASCSRFSCFWPDRLLTLLVKQISYGITPLICFAVVGSLKASEMAIGHQ
ncbi:unnamed protein product [Periconia digitata]|uniref:PIN-like protein n=1 Tax=Periconia digitata TaxID=1303443 RepID=A0A9W4UH42_9PLEO|nr:unnamed protein product [Periconia digitata]